MIAPAIMILAVGYLLLYSAFANTNPVDVVKGVFSS